MICISSNNDKHPVPKTFTPLQPTTLHSTSLHLSTLHFFLFKLHPTTLHCPFNWFNPIYISYCSLLPLIITVHLTSLCCNFRWFSPHFYSFHFTWFIIAFLTLFLKSLGLQGKIPNTSAGCWFHFLIEDCHGNCGFNFMCASCIICYLASLIAEIFPILQLVLISHNLLEMVALKFSLL